MYTSALASDLHIERIDPTMRQLFRFFCVAIIVYFALAVLQAQTSRFDRIEDENRMQQHQIEHSAGDISALEARVGAYDAIQVERRITTLEANSEIQTKLLYGLLLAAVAGLVDIFKRWRDAALRPMSIKPDDDEDES